MVYSGIYHDIGHSRTQQNSCKNVSMPHIDEGAKQWELEWAGRIGRAVRERRMQLGLTAERLAGRTEALGYPISRVAISKIETNKRAGKVDIAEVAILAAALTIPPVMLLYPSLPHGSYRYLPSVQNHALDGLLWFTGETLGYPGFGEFGADDPAVLQTAAQPLNLSRTFHEAERARRIAVAAAETSRGAATTSQETEFLDRSAAQQLRVRDQIISVMRTLGLPVSSDFLGEDQDA